jgi:hypothetical protein
MLRKCLFLVDITISGYRSPNINSVGTTIKIQEEQDMTKTPVQSTINNPKLFISPSMKDVFKTIQDSNYRWKDQPFWPQKRISFTTKDRGNRRRLIEALVSKKSTDELRSIGYQLLECTRVNPCGSPLCNYCRTKLQDKYQKRVLQYFGNTASENLIWLTILDDLTYDPMNDAQRQIDKMRSSLRGLLDRNFPKQVRLFGGFEIDVKLPKNLADSDSNNLLLEYGLQDNNKRACMPHLHAIVDLGKISRQIFSNRLKNYFSKSSQISTSKLRPEYTKEDNLISLARYPFKFRYQFADNILRERPSYGSLFDVDTLMKYTQVIHSLKGQRGVIGFEFRYNHLAVLNSLNSSVHQ